MFRWCRHPGSYPISCNPGHPVCDAHLKSHTQEPKSEYSDYVRQRDNPYLHRYLAEFDFRYSNRVAVGVDDKVRAETALQGVRGKRLTYETVSRRWPAAEVRIVW